MSHENPIPRTGSVWVDERGTEHEVIAIGTFEQKDSASVDVVIHKRRDRLGCDEFQVHTLEGFIEAFKSYVVPGARLQIIEQPDNQFVQIVGQTVTVLEVMGGYAEVKSDEGGFGTIPVWCLGPLDLEEE